MSGQNVAMAPQTFHMGSLLQEMREIEEAEIAHAPQTGSTHIIHTVLHTLILTHTSHPALYTLILTCIIHTTLHILILTHGDSTTQ